MLELIVCTVIWGTSFVAQKLGSEALGPVSINCFRNLLAGAFLFAVVFCRDRRTRSRERSPRATWIGGTLSGICLFVAMLTQQLGIERTTTGVSAFLTANYVLFVPVFAFVLGRRTGWAVWFGVAMAMAGTYFLSFASLAEAKTFSLGAGEAWTLLCAAVFAVQIMIVDRFIGASDPWRFSMVQMTVAGVVGLPFVFLPSETARLAACLSDAGGAGFAPLVKGVLAVVYLGIGSSGLGYTLQNLGQAKVPASTASIVMSLEGVFAVVAGWLIIGDVLTLRQSLGCALILSAVTVASRTGRR